MFAGDEMLLDVSFAVAGERLAQFAAGGMLAAPSAEAYGGQAAGLVRVGAAGISKLVRGWAGQADLAAWPSGGRLPGQVAGCFRSWMPISGLFPSGSTAPC